MWDDSCESSTRWMKLSAVAGSGLARVGVAATIAWSSAVTIAWSSAVAAVPGGAWGSLLAPARRGRLGADGRLAAPDLLVASLALLMFAALFLLPVPVIAARQWPLAVTWPPAPRRA